MSFLHVQWIIKPLISPQPRLSCNNCGKVQPFKTTDKVRLNANGKLLDAWLIYRCTHCRNVWNRPIFERRNIKDIDPATLDSLQNNDPDWVESFAFNIGQLRDKAKIIDEFPQIEIRKLTLSRPENSSDKLHLSLRVLFPTSLRCDRLLASELRVSRSRIEALKVSGCMTAIGQPLHIGKAIKNNMAIQIDLSNETDWLAIVNAARGH